MKKNKPAYLAIDSDVLRTLTHLDVLKMEHGHIDVSKIRNKVLKDDFNYFIKLYNAIVFDEVRPLIVDAVYQESKHSPSLISFMKNYCYFPNVNAANYQEKAEKARKLAIAYTNQYKDSKGQICDAPMKKEFVADINKYVPSNDCFIMAQATIENCPLLTGNGKDFIFNEKSADKYNHERVKGIVEINIANGYNYQDEKGHNTTPKPIKINTLAGLLKYEDYFMDLNQKDDYEKASTIL